MFVCLLAWCFAYHTVRKGEMEGVYHLYLYTTLLYQHNYFSSYYMTVSILLRCTNILSGIVSTPHILANRTKLTLCSWLPYLFLKCAKYMASTAPRRPFSISSIPNRVSYATHSFPYHQASFGLSAHIESNIDRVRSTPPQWSLLVRLPKQSESRGCYTPIPIPE